MATTWIDPEEKAYNTYAGGHSRSGRKGMVVFPDGKIRKVTLGVPDTYFTIPCHSRVNGKYVSGHITCDDDGTYRFNHSGAGWYGLLAESEF